MMEKWDNALVNVQLRWQRRHTVGTLRFAFALSLLGFVVAAVTLLTPLRVSLPNLLFATPILLCVPTFLTATPALLWYELKHDLSRWGQLRIVNYRRLQPTASCRHDAGMKPASLQARSKPNRRIKRAELMSRCVTNPQCWQQC
jgi:hypothetical protein